MSLGITKDVEGLMTRYSKRLNLPKDVRVQKGDAPRLKKQVRDAVGAFITSGTLNLYLYDAQGVLLDEDAIGIATLEDPTGSDFQDPTWDPTVDGIDGYNCEGFINWTQLTDATLYIVKGWTGNSTSGYPVEWRVFLND